MADEQKVKEQDCCEPIRVSPEGQSAAFSIYGACPENPSGMMICYTVFRERDLTTGVHDCELWVCDRDLRNHRRVFGGGRTWLHNGMQAQWVDDDSIAFRCSRGPKAGTYVMNIDGTVEYGPYPSCTLGHDSINGLVLLGSLGVDPKLGDVPGLYCLDTRSGRISRIFAYSDYADEPWYDENRKYTAWHAQLSPDGSKVMWLFVDQTEGWKEIKMIYSSDLDGNRRQLCPKWLLHYLWYDNDHMYGVVKDRTVEKWAMDGKVVASLGACAAHPGMSLDRRWIASEERPVRRHDGIFLYAIGAKAGDCIKLDECTHEAFDWKARGIRAHCNPTFSRDGTRIYYLKGIDGDSAEAWCVDVRHIVAQPKAEEGR